MSAVANESDEDRIISIRFGPDDADPQHFVQMLDAWAHSVFPEFKGTIGMRLSSVDPRGRHIEALAILMTRRGIVPQSVQDLIRRGEYSQALEALAWIQTEEIKYVR